MNNQFIKILLDLILSESSAPQTNVLFTPAIFQSCDASLQQKGWIILSIGLEVNGFNKFTIGKTFAYLLINF